MYNKYSEQSFDKSDYQQDLFNLCKTEGDQFFQAHILCTKILKNQPSLDIQDDKGNTFLHYACINGNFKIMQVLLEKGADANLLNNEGFTAFHYACENKNINSFLLEKLLAHGANPEISNGEQENALHILLSNSDSQIDLPIIKKMLEKTPKNASTDLNLNYLHYAVAHKSISKEWIEYFIQAGVDIHQTTTGNLNCLNYVCCEMGTNNFEIFSYLLNKDINFNLENEEPSLIRTCLMILDPTDVDYVHLDALWKMAKEMLKKGINVEEEITGLDESLLHLACYSKKNDNECIQLLLENKADPKKLDSKGHTCLHALANRSYHPDKIVDLRIVNTLIKAGVDINQKNNDQETALDIALNEKLYPLALYLILQGVNLDEYAQEDIDNLIFGTEQNKNQLSPLAFALHALMSYLIKQDKAVACNFIEKLKIDILDKFSLHKNFTSFEGKIREKDAFTFKDGAFTLFQCLFRINKKEQPPKFLKFKILKDYFVGADENQCMALALQQLEDDESARIINEGLHTSNQKRKKSDSYGDLDNDDPSLMQPSKWPKN